MTKVTDLLPFALNFTAGLNLQTDLAHAIARESIAAISKIEENFNHIDERRREINMKAAILRSINRRLLQIRKK